MARRNAKPAEVNDAPVNTPNADAATTPVGDASDPVIGLDGQPVSSSADVHAPAAPEPAATEPDAAQPAVTEPAAPPAPAPEAAKPAVHTPAAADPMVADIQEPAELQALRKELAAYTGAAELLPKLVDQRLAMVAAFESAEKDYKAQLAELEHQIRVTHDRRQWAFKRVPEIQAQIAQLSPAGK